MEDRLIGFRRLLVLGIGALVLRLGFLQVVEGRRFRQLAKQNCLRLIPESAPRGLIFDRYGQVLAANHVTFQIAVVAQDLVTDSVQSRFQRASSAAPDRQRLFAKLGRVVGRSPQELERQFHLSQSLPFLPAALVTRVPKAVALQVEELRLRMPGVVVQSVATREYPFGPVAAHLLGYVGKPSEELFPMLKQYGVRAEDMVGRAGLEEAFDAALRGQTGGALIQVNHRGRQVRALGYRPPTPGDVVTLTIDAKLEALIHEQFGSQPGAAVVLKPQTGEVLAMVSVPSYDPTIFATQDQRAIQAVLTDAGSPLMNRAIAGVYLPGSIVKPITGMTALENHIVTPTDTITCPGFLALGDRRFHCWNRDGHGPLTLPEALTQSCNVYFMQLSRRLGLAKLEAGFASVGFGRRTGWLWEEQAGHLPRGRRFSEGEVAMLGMGQGEILITPLQAAVMVSAIANGGSLVQPWLVSRVGEQPAGRAHLTALHWSREHVATIQQGMLAVVNDPRGTGIGAHSEQVVIAGKTGTAQTHIPGRTHGWFIGFCPADQPIAAMAIVAEYGGSGGDIPAGIGKAICEYLVAPPTSAPPTHAVQRPPI